VSNSSSKTEVIFTITSSPLPKTVSMMVGLHAVIFDPKQLTVLIQKHNNQLDAAKRCIGDEEGPGHRLPFGWHHSCTCLADKMYIQPMVRGGPWYCNPALPDAQQGTLKDIIS
jgi:hypothetical protein